MAIDVLQRPQWDGTPRELGTCWILHKGSREARCQMWSHVFGWELRLIAGSELLYSQVCRTQDELLDTFDQWKAAMLEKGWS